MAIAAAPIDLPSPHVPQEHVGAAEAVAPTAASDKTGCGGMLPQAGGEGGNGVVNGEGSGGKEHIHGCLLMRE